MGDWVSDLFYAGSRLKKNVPRFMLWGYFTKDDATKA